MRHGGLFIAVEGPEGAGKSSQLTRLAARLRAEGIEPVLTREPGGTPTGARIRDLLLDPAAELVPLAELLLYAADRAQHVAERIVPALQSGRLVITDRYGGATVAYQGHGRGLDLELVHTLNAHATGGLRPDLTLVFDVPPELGLARVAGRGAPDRLERADLAFHERVRAGFAAQAEDDPSWRLIDATGAEADVADAVWGHVERALSTWRST